MAATGVTPFVDVSNVTYNSVAVFGVKRITVDRRVDQVLSKDNNHLHYTASHIVFLEDTVTVESTDLAALVALQAQGGTAHDLVFTTVVSSQNVATDTLANQTVTVKNVVWTDVRSNHEMKAEGTFSLSGKVIGLADDTDPISYATGS